MSSSLLSAGAFREEFLRASVSIKRGSMFPETFTARAYECMFPQRSRFCHTENIVSSIKFCFQDADYASATRQTILTRIRTGEQLEKLCEHEQVSTHLIFASDSSKGKILRAPLY